MSDETGTTTVAEAVLPKNTKSNNKKFAWFHLIWVVLTGVALTLLLTDHFKYGAKSPPKTWKWIRNVAGIMMLISLLMAFVYIGYIAKKLKGGFWYAVMFMFFGVMVLSMGWWMWYHFRIRPEYDNDPSKMPQYHRTLHKIAMWTAIVCMIITILIACSLGGEACLFFLMVQ